MHQFVVSRGGDSGSSDFWRTWIVWKRFQAARGNFIYIEESRHHDADEASIACDRAIMEDIKQARRMRK